MRARFSEAMVLMEMGASAGILKLSAAGSGGAAVALAGPPPLDMAWQIPHGTPWWMPTPLDAGVPAPLDASLLAPLHVAGRGHPVVLTFSSAAASASSWLWPKMTVLAGEIGEIGRDFGSTALSATTVVQAGLPGRALELACASAAVYSVLSKFSFLDDKADRALEDEEGQELVQDGIRTPARRYRDLTIYPIALSAFAISDILKITALIDTLGSPLAMPLRTFAIGGLLLSFPADLGIAWAKDKVGFRKALFIELAACTASLFWLTWGTHLLSVSPIDAVNAPLLFWACFVHCVLTWSGFSSIIAVTILSSAVTAWASTAPK